MISPTSISGVRIWLSGAIPNDASPEQATRLRDFAKALAKLAFREGAQILHGFHPSITPTLLEAAPDYKRASDRSAMLSLFVSTYFRDPQTSGYGGRTVVELERDCELHQIPRAPDRERSLAELRGALASHADVMIAFGGEWWEKDRSKAGVPAEFLLAIARGIPVFLVGGLGGAAGGYLAQHPEILKHLRNGLDLQANEALAENDDIGDLAGRLIDQISRLPLGRRETASGQRFRILSLDGGGIRGAFTAALLAQWEQMSNLRVADHFDLIAGTSTGGILAIGLGLGLSAGEILNFYREHGPAIFSRIGLWASFRHAVLNKFEASILEEKLSLAFDRDDKPATLADSRKRLLISSYNMTSNCLRLYRTSHHPSAKGHDHLRAVVVARATSAAPTYFEPATVDDSIAPHESVDGGVWANCPAMAALGEAVGVLKIPLDRIEVLSVGTAGMAAFVESPDMQGKAGWAAKAPDLFLNSQMEATLSYIRQLLGDRFLRVDDVRPRVQAMDNPDDLSFLIARGAEVGEDVAKDVMARFVNGVSAGAWRGV